MNSQKYSVLEMENLNLRLLKRSLRHLFKDKFMRKKQYYLIM